MSNQGIFSYAAIQELLKATKVPDRTPDKYLNPFASMFGGIPIRSSSLFPYTQDCGKCLGSGSGGEERTYCMNCKGGGRITYQGTMIQGDQMIVLVSHHPRKFEPSFPYALPVRPLPNRSVL